MRLSIIRATELGAEQRRHLDERLSAPEHQYDAGPSSVWRIYRPETFYVFVLKDSGLPIAIADVSGPPERADAGWWIDSQLRGKGYGYELIELLAAELKRRGFHGVGPIRIITRQPEYEEPSRKMKLRLQQHFL